MWGTEKQSHYKQGREIQSVELNQIQSLCQCGYLTLNPTNEFEQHNGGLTVRRSKVVVVDNGQPVKKLKVLTVINCNACVNGWK